MPEERERKSTRRGAGRDEQETRGRGSRERTENAEPGRDRDDVRLTGGEGIGPGERVTFFGRAQERRSRQRQSVRHQSQGGGAYGGQGGFGAAGSWSGQGGAGYSRSDSSDERYRGGEGGQGGYRGASSGSATGGKGGGHGGSARERGGREGKERFDGEDRQPEYGGERGGWRAESYGGARSMRDYEERGYEGGHRDTSMGGRADYADYSNEPGWEPSYGGRSAGGTGEQEGRRRGRWQREPLTAREIMTKDVRSVRPDSSVRDVAEVMRDENTGIVPVVDENRRLVGVITDRDIVMRSIPEGKDPARLRVAELMTDDVECATPDESMHEVIRMMGDNQVRRIPVVDQSDRLVGIISMADVATRADFDEELQEALEDISARRSFWRRLFS